MGAGCVSPGPDKACLPPLLLTSPLLLCPGKNGGHAAPLARISLETSPGQYAHHCVGSLRAPAFTRLSAHQRDMISPLLPQIQPSELNVTFCLWWDETYSPSFTQMNPPLHSFTAPLWPITTSNEGDSAHWSSVSDFGMSTLWPFLKLTEDSAIFPFLLPEPELAMCHSVAIIRRKFLFTTRPLPTDWESLKSGTKLYSWLCY